MTINDLQDEVIDEFDGITDWMDRYAYIIEQGGELAPLSDNDKTPEHLIEGCQSRVWVVAGRGDEGNVTLKADSDAMIVKGIAALLLRVLSGHKPEEIAKADLYFIDRIGLGEHLSPTRSNGLVAMVKQIKDYARAYAMLDKAAGK